VTAPSSREPPRATESVVFVLVEPQQSGNVGAAARAMKNMGLGRLVIVNPPAFDPEQARWMAPGCDDMIERLRIVPTLDEALAGVTRVIATTARHRKHDQPVLEPRQAAVQGLDGGVTAVLFGREDDGLDAATVARASALLRIPTPAHASLNLAQAVLLVANAWFEEARSRGLRATGRPVGGRTTKPTTWLEPHERPADVSEMEGAVQDVLAVLSGVGYAAAPEKVAITVRSALQRAQPTLRELNALRGMLKKLRN
jgi:TrmH family RNA methyltransferase